MFLYESILYWRAMGELAIKSAATLLIIVSLSFNIKYISTTADVTMSDLNVGSDVFVKNITGTFEDGICQTSSGEIRSEESEVISETIEDTENNCNIDYDIDVTLGFESNGSEVVTKQNININELIVRD